MSSDLSLETSSGRGFFEANKELFQYDRFATNGESAAMSSYLQRSAALKPSYIGLDSPGKRRLQLDALARVFDPNFEVFRVGGESPGNSPKRGGNATGGGAGVASPPSPSRLDPIPSPEVFARNEEVLRGTNRRDNYVPSWPSNQAQAVTRQFFQSPSLKQAEVPPREEETSDRQLAAEETPSIARTPSYESLDRYPVSSSVAQSSFPAGLATASIVGRSRDEQNEWGFRRRIEGRHVNNSSVSLSWTAGEKVGFGDRGLLPRRGRGRPHHPETYHEESRRPAGITSRRPAGAVSFSPRKAALAAQGRRVLQDVMSAASNCEIGDERIVATPVESGANGSQSPLHQQEMLFTHFKAKGNVGIINDNLPIKKSIFTEISNPMNDRDYNPLERQHTPRRTRGDLMRKLQIMRKHDARPAPYYSNNLKATHKRRLDAYARLEERTAALKERLTSDLARANEVIKAQEAGGLSAYITMDNIEEMKKLQARNRALAIGFD